MEKTKKTEKILAKVKQYAPAIAIGLIACGVTGMLGKAMGVKSGIKYGIKIGINSLSAAILCDRDESMRRLEREYANASKEDIEDTVKFGRYVLDTCWKE